MKTARVQAVQVAQVAQVVQVVQAVQVIITIRALKVEILTRFLTKKCPATLTINNKILC